MEKVKTPSIVTLSILTLLTIVLWILLSVYRAFNKPAEVSVAREVILALNPRLDTEILSNLDSRIFYTEEQIGETNLLVITDEQEVEEPVATQSSEINQEVATESAEVSDE